MARRRWQQTYSKLSIDCSINRAFIRILIVARAVAVVVLTRRPAVLFVDGTAVPPVEHVLLAVVLVSEQVLVADTADAVALRRSLTPVHAQFDDPTDASCTTYRP